MEERDHTRMARRGDGLSSLQKKRTGGGFNRTPAHGRGEPAREREHPDSPTRSGIPPPSSESSNWLTCVPGFLFGVQSLGGLDSLKRWSTAVDSDAHAVVAEGGRGGQGRGLTRPGSWEPGPGRVVEPETLRLNRLVRHIIIRCLTWRGT